MTSYLTLFRALFVAVLGFVALMPTFVFGTEHNEPPEPTDPGDFTSGGQGGGGFTSGGQGGGGFTSGGQGGSSGSEGGLRNPLGDVDTLEEFLTIILDAVVRLGTYVLVLAIVFVGFKFVMAQGNEEKIQDARNALVWTVIGGLILLGATAISVVIRETADTLSI